MNEHLWYVAQCISRAIHNIPAVVHRSKCGSKVSDQVLVMAIYKVLEVQQDAIKLES